MGSLEKMNTEKGSILIFTLWVLIILAMLSIILSRGASSDVKLARHESYNIKATYLARAGVMKMLTEIVRDINSYDALNEDWNRDRDNPKELVFRGDRVLYGSSDENRRLNLNSKTLKELHLVRLGMDSSMAKKIAEYKGAKGARGFEFMEELFLAEGMTREVYSLIKDYVTIYGGTESAININTASEKVLSAILGNWSLVQDIVEFRRGADGIEGTEDDAIFKDSSEISSIDGLDPGLFTVKSTVFRVWADAIFPDDKSIFKSVEAVIDRNGRIYHWKEY